MSMVKIPPKPKRCLYRQGSSTLRFRDADWFALRGGRGWRVPADAVFSDGSLSRLTRQGAWRVAREEAREARRDRPERRRRKRQRLCLVGKERQRYEWLRSCSQADRRTMGVEAEYRLLRERAGHELA